MRSTFILLLCCMCFACAKYPGVPEKYHALLDKALETSGTNQPELAKALESAGNDGGRGLFDFLHAGAGFENDERG
mgnify:CR=1 FL=1